MQLANYCSDLYILPESDFERDTIVSYLKHRGYGYRLVLSNVQDQSWYGNMFFEVPFMSNDQVRGELQDMLDNAIH